MLHSRGELLLMLDADGATKVSDLEKLENQVSRLFDIQRCYICETYVSLDFVFSSSSPRVNNTEDLDPPLHSCTDCKLEIFLACILKMPL